MFSNIINADYMDIYKKNTIMNVFWIMQILKRQRDEMKRENLQNKICVNIVAAWVVSVTHSSNVRLVQDMLEMSGTLYPENIPVLSLSQQTISFLCLMVHLEQEQNISESYFRESSSQTTV